MLTFNNKTAMKRATNKELAGALKDSLKEYMYKFGIVPKGISLRRYIHRNESIIVLCNNDGGDEEYSVICSIDGSVQTDDIIPFIQKLGSIYTEIANAVVAALNRATPNYYDAETNEPMERPEWDIDKLEQVDFPITMTPASPNIPTKDLNPEDYRLSIRATAEELYPLLLMALTRWMAKALDSNKSLANALKSNKITIKDALKKVKKPALKPINRLLIMQKENASASKTSISIVNDDFVTFDFLVLENVPYSVMQIMCEELTPTFNKMVTDLFGGGFKR